MKKILVAVDGSAPSIHAATMAAQLAQAMGSELTLMHVEPPLMLPPEAPYVEVGAWTDAMRQQGEAILKKVAESIPKVPTVTRNVIGPPAETIVDWANEGSYDLVVVGNTGRGAVSRVLLGSVADRIVHICKRPVLVVR